MISILLSFLFFSLAAVCNAVMDKLSFHFHKSVFHGLDPKFWEPSVSWECAKTIPFTKYKVDAWHLFKSGMIIFICIGFIFAYVSNVFADFNILSFTVILLMLGVLWNATFNLFFNHLLAKNV